MTSNAGAHALRKQRSMGFGGAEDSERTYESMKESIMGEVKNIFRPEFLNRVDEIIVFHALEQAEIDAIAALLLRQVCARLEERGIRLDVDESALQLVSRAGYDIQFGARPLRRAIQRMVEDALSEEILLGRIRLGDHVRVAAEGEQLAFTPVQDEDRQPALAGQLNSD